MKIHRLALNGAAEITCSKHEDERGSFARLFCQKELLSLNNNHQIQQVNSSYTKKTGTIRGLHYQLPPYCEAKVVRCISGRVFDVMVDLRKGSPTFSQSQAIILDASKMNMVYIPKGFAHGFQTLEDNCQMLYLHTEFYAPDYDSGIYYDSPLLNVKWPLEALNLSDKDKNLTHLDMSFEGIEGI
jgi:dTDP-4-dehydrorhamnose 3,5-epimerase